MKTNITPEITDVTWDVALKEAMLNTIVEKARHQLIGYLQKAFGLKLNDIKFDQNAPSNNFIHFTRFFGQTMLDVSLGLEDISIKISRPENFDQVKNLIGYMHNVYQNFPIAEYAIAISRHFKVNGDLDTFLEFMCPFAPDSFKEMLNGRGVIYGLNLDDHELNCQIIATKSLLIPNGLFLRTHFSLKTHEKEYEKIVEKIASGYRFVLKGFMLEIEGENYE